MSGRKSNLAVFQNIVNGDMSGDVTSSVTNIEFIDNVGVQLNFTGTPTGTFKIQVSADYKQNSQGVVTNAGNWIDLSFSTTPSASGSASQIYIDMTQLSAPYIRVKYVRASGSGTLNGYIVGKQV